MTTLEDILQATKPPLALLDHLSRQQVRRDLSPSALAWLERWRRIYAGDPDPIIDGLAKEVHQ